MQVEREGRGRRTVLNETEDKETIRARAAKRGGYGEDEIFSAMDDHGEGERGWHAGRDRDGRRLRTR